jgi:lactate racemase
MNHSLKYGKTSKTFNLPEGSEKLEVSEPVFEINKQTFYKTFSEYLPDDTSRYKNVGIIISDKTRLCGYPLYLPWITEILQSKGAGIENITFYIAYGTHPRQTEEESIASYGDTYKNYRFIHHSCTDEQVFIQLGTTLRGTPVKVRKDVLESSLLITFGAISHHYFAGYGGGRKLLFPGLAERKAIYSNHGLFLDREHRRLAEGCQPGKLIGSPLAEDLKEINDLMPSRISIHGILSSKGEVCKLLVGENYTDFIDACNEHDSYYRSGSNKQYDLVLASSGGYPKDINFIQAHKSVHHAAAFLKDGGKLIILSECVDGIASNYFLKYLEAGSFEKAFSMLENNYEGNGGTALSMMTKTKRIRIYMMTSLDEKICQTLNVTRIDEQGIQQVLDKEKGSVALIQNSSMLVR